MPIATTLDSEAIHQIEFTRKIVSILRPRNLIGMEYTPIKVGCPKFCPNGKI